MVSLNKKGENMQILINGLSYEVEENISVFHLLEHLSQEKKISFSGSVVLLNETLIPKSKWAETIVEASSKVEVLSFVSGG